ncbi:MAG: aroK-1 [Acidobacteria bacterium]|nr:aroK-1 [Acidobacteriota bacterium]
MEAEEKSNLILCGFMATGKSSVGKRLAEMTGYEFLDMDEAIEADEGMTIPEIFASRGEAVFRELECRMVDQVAQRRKCVVATGGGTTVNPQNLETLRRCGILINLTADIQTILLRAGSGEDRPMLQQGDRVERIRTLLQNRAEAYGKADFAVDTSSRSIEEVAQLIVNRLRNIKAL